MNPSHSVAQRFHAARFGAYPLNGFPGPLPDTLASAYAIQDEAIALWPDAIAGWKVAAIHPDLRPALGAMRLVGPAFTRGAHRVEPGRTAEVAAIRNGFIAAETEIAVVLAADLPTREHAWDAAALIPFIAGVYVGFEIAGSPLPSINDLGPTAVISDFGNNTALGYGAPIPGWADGALDALETETRIDGQTVGRGRATGPNGGPLDALAFLANHLPGRGLALRAGDVVCTGATTGIHPIAIGQTAEMIAAGPPLAVRITERRPWPDPPT